MISPIYLLLAFLFLVYLVLLYRNKTGVKRRKKRGFLEERKKR
jgi:hypothetical protein